MLCFFLLAKEIGGQNFPFGTHLSHSDANKTGNVCLQQKNSVSECDLWKKSDSSSGIPIIREFKVHLYL